MAPTQSTSLRPAVALPIGKLSADLKLVKRRKQNSLCARRYRQNRRQEKLAFHNSCFELSEQIRKLEDRIQNLTSSMKLAGIHVPPATSDLIRECVSTAHASLRGNIAIPEEDEDAIFEDILQALDVPKDERMEMDQVHTHLKPTTNPLYGNGTIAISKTSLSPEDHKPNPQTTQQLDAEILKEIWPPSSPRGIATLPQITSDEMLNHDEIFQEIFQFIEEDFSQTDKPPILPERPCGRSIFPFGEIMTSPIC